MAGDFLFNEMKKLYPEASDDEVVAKIQAADAPVASADPVPAAPVETPYKEMVLENIRQKYLGDKYSDAARQKLVDENNSFNPLSALSAGLVSFGTGLAGGDAGSAGSAFLKNEQAKKDNRLNVFDKGRSAILDDVKSGQDLMKFEEDQALAKREGDQNSQETSIYRAIGSEMMPNFDFSKMNARQIKALIPSTTKLYEIQQKKIKDSEDRDVREKEFGIRMKELASTKSERREDKQIAKEDKQTETERKLKTPYGLANTEDDSKQLKEAHESKQNFDSKIQEMIDLRNKYGAEAYNREAVARGKQLSKDLLLEYKNMAKLGVLSKTDTDIIEAIIPADPLEFQGSQLLGQDPILHKLKKFQEDSNKDFATRVATRTRQGIKNYEAGVQPSPKSDSVSTGTKPSWAR